MTKTQTQALSKAELQRQLQTMGFAVRIDGSVLEATKGDRRLRLIVRGLQKRSAVFLKKKDLQFVDALIVYVISSKDCWVFTKSEALKMLEDYARTPTRKGHPPAEEGFNVSQLGEPHGWQRINSLVQE